MSEFHCHNCEYTRVDRIGLRSPPFFGPPPKDMQPCAGCWHWKQEMEAEMEAQRPKWSQSQFDAAVAKARDEERYHLMYDIEDLETHWALDPSVGKGEVFAELKARIRARKVQP